eukprot:TRINITY_DN2550_c0_g2_i1.p1 TRINITY_DN2550_c0_g2~~TRINITY_DN2550_c0_g2_i1.p1  ORF type:complete len:502 (-),score=-11.29 TRINITY_DN2550_c0_g2_i1:127-1632(-)
MQRPGGPLRSSAAPLLIFTLLRKKSAMTVAMAKTPHVAIFTIPVMGHLIPFCELAKVLANDFQCKITFILLKEFITSAQASAYLSSLANSAPQVTFLDMPKIQVADESGKNQHYTHIQNMIDKSLEPVKQILGSLDPPVSAFITNLFCTSYLKPVAQMGIPPYVFYTNSAACLRVMYSVETLASQISAPLREVEFGIQLPGLPAIPARDLPAPLLEDRSSLLFRMFSRDSVLLKDATGILINTFEELEQSALQALSDPNLPAVYSVGPLISDRSKTVKDEKEIGGVDCLEWLDRQEPESVVFVSFGSHAALSVPQMAELAAGLEASGHKFLWVVREELRTAASYYRGEKGRGTEEILPEGFLDRTKDRGLIVPGWVPQIAVLSHPSVGGFVSHCGWNSALEAIFCGVAVVPWPLLGEQRLNAVMMVKEYGVAVDMMAQNAETVKREEVERAVKELLGGEMGRKARDRARELREKSRNALQREGSSWKALAAAVSVWADRQR